MSVASDVTIQVRRLADLDLQALRLEWRRLWGAPPKLRSPELLRLIMAWRIQAAALGGLDEVASAALSQRSPRGRGPAVKTGTVLAREWRGVRHEVEVLEGAVAYQGQRYASLSEVARLITGSRWNGPRFFGLRGEGP